MAFRGGFEMVCHAFLWLFSSDLAWKHPGKQGFHRPNP